MTEQTQLAFSEQRKWTRWAILGWCSAMIAANFISFAVYIPWHEYGDYVYVQCVQVMYMAMELFYFFRYRVFSWWLIFSVRMTLCFFDFVCLTCGAFDKFGMLLTNFIFGVLAIILYSRLWERSCWKVDLLEQPDSLVSTENQESSAFSRKTRCARGFIPPISTLMACSNGVVIGLIVYWYQLTDQNLFTPMMTVFVLFLTYEVCEFVYFFWFKAFSWWTTLAMRVSMLLVNFVWIGFFTSSFMDVCNPSGCIWNQSIVAVIIWIFLSFSSVLQLGCIACYWKIRRVSNAIQEISVVENGFENPAHESTDQATTED